MDALRKLVLATATMSESQLREARQLAEKMDGDSKARELVVNLIDIFIAIGEDTDRRAQLAAACLMAIDEGERQSGGSSAGSGKKSKAGCAVLPLLASLAGAAWLLLR